MSAILHCQKMSPASLRVIRKFSGCCRCKDATTVRVCVPLPLSRSCGFSDGRVHAPVMAVLSNKYHVHPKRSFQSPIYFSGSVQGKNPAMYFKPEFLTFHTNLYPVTSIMSGSRIKPLLPEDLTMAVTKRTFHDSACRREKDVLKPSSKVEESVEVIKETLKDKEKDKLVTAVESGPAMELVKPVKKKSLWQKIVDELKHYYHGFRLLLIDINVSRKLVWMVLNGHTLTRREHRQLVRTTSDLFRLLPFSVFIIVPFMELLLPVALKLFPGMLPSTFQTANEREDKMKTSLKMKIEMAKFLQQTLDRMSLKSKGHKSETAKEFAEFFQKVRQSGEQATNKEIMKFSKLFEDEITLDSLSRQQLTALCRVIEIHPIGTNNFLRFQLRMKLRSLTADDKMIQKEGVESLNISELQQACRARGMRAYGIPEQRLRSQLQQWLDLSLNEKVPPSLLLLSRALYLPDDLTVADQLKATISALPETAATQAKAQIGEREGKIDNKTKIEVIREEERKIKEERRERKLEEQMAKEKEVQPAVAAAAAAAAKAAEPVVDKELLVDKAPVIGDEVMARLERIGEEKEDEALTAKDFEVIEDALESIGRDKKKPIIEKEELDDLKEELADYEEDLQDLQDVLKATGQTRAELRESKAAQRLFRKVNKMINSMDVVVSDLSKEEEQIKKTLKEATSENEEMVSLDELRNAIKQFQNVPDASRLEKIVDVIEKMDADRDGVIKVDDVLKVIQLIGKENVKLTPQQIEEIMDLLDKEEVLEVEGKIERALEKEFTESQMALEDKDKSTGHKNINAETSGKKTATPSDDKDASRPSDKKDSKSSSTKPVQQNSDKDDSVGAKAQTLAEAQALAQKKNTAASEQKTK